MEAVFCFQVSDVSANKIPQYMTQRFAVLSCKANSDERLQIPIYQGWTYLAAITFAFLATRLTTVHRIL